ncbi:MAG TPA: hypothetical protein VGF48_05775 [Thermoanaerobaculia bacterium]|jgi:hypothetical protein
MSLPLEKQVCSPDRAKRLKELGVKQESLFVWSAWSDHAPAEHTDCHELHWEVTPKHEGSLGERYSAFTVAELGEMLPKSFRDEQRIKWFVAFHWSPVGARVSYENADEIELHALVEATEADARAKMLIYLIENNLLKVEQINQPYSP